MDFGAFINGDFRKIAQDEIAVIQGAARKAVTEGSQKGQAVARTQVEVAGLGPGVSKAWQFQIYPKGSKRADNPTGFLFSRAARIVAAFDAGVTIVPSHGSFLFIPLPAAIELGLDRMSSRPGARGGGAGAKWSNIKAAAERFGTLRFVPLQGGGRALLVVDARVGKFKGGDRFYKIKATSRRTASVVLFLLVRRVSLPKRLDIDAVAAAANEAMYAAYAEGLAVDGGG